MNRSPRWTAAIERARLALQPAQIEAMVRGWLLGRTGLALVWIAWMLTGAAIAFDIIQVIDALRLETAPMSRQLDLALPYCMPLKRTTTIQACCRSSRSWQFSASPRHSSTAEQGP
jgi:hypothetical protein